MINKDVFKSLSRKNGNEILIWSWNDSAGMGVSMSLKLVVPTVVMQICLKPIFYFYLDMFPLGV